MDEDFAETLNSLMEWWWKWERRNWTEEKAQLELLWVFTHAYKFGYCGHRGREKFKTLLKRKPEANKLLHLMDGELVEKQLRMLSRKKNSEQARRIDLSRAWWTAWELGFDVHDHGIRRRYVLKKKK